LNFIFKKGNSKKKKKKKKERSRLKKKKKERRKKRKKESKERKKERRGRKRGRVQSGWYKCIYLYLRRAEQRYLYINKCSSLLLFLKYRSVL
jgi:hypothetical protein